MCLVGLYVAPPAAATSSTTPVLKYLCVHIRDENLVRKFPEKYATCCDSETM